MNAPNTAGQVPRRPGQSAWRRSGPWFLASYGLGVVDAGLPFNRWLPPTPGNPLSGVPWSTLLVGLIGLMALSLWMVGLNRWSDAPRAGASERTQARPFGMLAGWLAWMLCWIVLVLGLIASGFALRHMLSVVDERWGLICLGLLGFNALGMWGSVASLQQRSPVGRAPQIPRGSRRRFGPQALRWVGLWAVLSLADAGVLGALVLTVPHGALWAALGEGVALGWSVVEVMILAAASQLSS